MNEGAYQLRVATHVVGSKELKGEVSGSLRHVFFLKKKTYGVLVRKGFENIVSECWKHLQQYLCDRKCIQNCQNRPISHPGRAVVVMPSVIIMIICLYFWKDVLCLKNCLRPLSLTHGVCTPGPLVTRGAFFRAYQIKYLRFKKNPEQRFVRIEEINSLRFRKTVIFLLFQ